MREISVFQPVVAIGAPPGRRRWLSPATVRIMEENEIHGRQLQVHASESPGCVPDRMIQNRQNDAQDLQLSMRGFGTRSTFGVCGVRLFVDGIPSDTPSGQGHATNFPRGIAQRIEVFLCSDAALFSSSAGASWDTERLSALAGLVSDRQAQRRHGFDNLTQAATALNQLGVTG